MKRYMANKQIPMAGWHIKPGEIYYADEIKGTGTGNRRRYRLCRTKSRSSVCATVEQALIDTMTELEMD